MDNETAEYQAQRILEEMLSMAGVEMREVNKILIELGFPLVFKDTWHTLRTVFTAPGHEGKPFLFSIFVNLDIEKLQAISDCMTHIEI